MSRAVNYSRFGLASTCSVVDELNYSHKSPFSFGLTIFRLLMLLMTFVKNQASSLCFLNHSSSPKLKFESPIQKLECVHDFLLLRYGRETEVYESLVSQMKKQEPGNFLSNELLLD